MKYLVDSDWVPQQYTLGNLKLATFREPTIIPFTEAMEAVVTIEDLERWVEFNNEVKGRT